MRARLLSCKCCGGEIAERRSRTQRRAVRGAALANTVRKKNVYATREHRGANVVSLRVVETRFLYDNVQR